MCPLLQHILLVALGDDGVTAGVVERRLQAHLSFDDDALRARVVEALISALVVAVVGVHTVT